MDERDMRTCEACGKDFPPLSMMTIGLEQGKEELHLCCDCVSECHDDAAVEIVSDELDRGNFDKVKRWVAAKRSFDTINAVVAALNAKGICAVNEYPGYVAIYLADDWEWSCGDEGGHWGAIKVNDNGDTDDKSSASLPFGVCGPETAEAIADAIEKHIRPFGGLLKAGSEKVLRAFNQALEKAKEADEAHKAKRLFAEDVHDAAQELQNKAFEVAKSLGWDWENVEEGQFASWCLKATETEIVEEGLKRFKKWSTMACGLTVAG